MTSQKKNLTIKEIRMTNQKKKEMKKSESISRRRIEILKEEYESIKNHIKPRPDSVTTSLEWIINDIKAILDTEN